MTIFEYIMVMVSIILALALAQLLRAVAELITSTRRYWVHIIWVVILALLSVLLLPTIVFLLAYLLVPSQRAEDTD